MTQRIAFGALVIAVIFGVVGIDALVARRPPWGSDLLARGSVVPSVLALISVAACLELVALFRRLNLMPYRTWAVLSCAVLVLAPWFGASGLLGKGPIALEAIHLQMVLITFTFVGAGVMAVFRQEASTGLMNVSATWVVIAYAGLLPSFLTLLRCDSYIPGEYGAWIVLAIVAVCKASDIGAYFVGSWVGRHKFIPRVSPAKSVEGLAGGVLASCAVSLLLFYLHRWTMGNEYPDALPLDLDRYIPLAHDFTIMYHRMSLSQAIILGIVMSIVGQMGDLIESIFKRSAGAKDSGGLVPGFGGILDMIDSPVAIAPVAWFLLTRVWAVV